MPSMKPEIQIVSNADALYQATAAEFVRQVRAAVETKGACTVALSRGLTCRHQGAKLISRDFILLKGK